MTRAFVIAALVLAACLDPLYEDGAPLTSGQAICCPNGELTTCYCPDPSKCLSLPTPCPGGRCSLTPYCAPIGGGGGSASGGGSGFGGGTAFGGGAASGGGAGGGSADAGGGDLDAGLSDGGAGGGASGGGGGASGGGGGASGGGGGASGGGGGAAGGGGGGGLEFCCLQGRITTCACPASGCASAPFTPCPGGACVSGSTTSLCR